MNIFEIREQPWYTPGMNIQTIIEIYRERNPALHYMDVNSRYGKVRLPAKTVDPVKELWDLLIAPYAEVASE